MDDPKNYAPRHIRQADYREKELLAKLEQELVDPVTTSYVTTYVNDYGDYVPGPRKVKALIKWAMLRGLV